jgi:heme exporter protein D
MIENFLVMGGYGFYVWTSFLIVTVFCFLLFYSTRKTLKKYERDFAKELDKLPLEHKKRLAKSSKIVSSILTSQNKLG